MDTKGSIKKLALVILLSLPSIVFAQNTRVDGIVLNARGNPVAGASVAVCTQPAKTTATPCTPPAPLCASLTDLVCSLPNPVTADGLGNYFFYIATDTTYTIQYFGLGIRPTAIADQKAGGGAGCSPGGASGSVLKNARGACAASSATDDANGFHFLGPNPYVDITQFGGRTVNPNATPAVPGITATCTAGSPSVAISSASSFKNNDGTVIKGCGAANGMGTMSAPTVTPSNSRGPNMSGDGVASPSGSTTYNYVVFACDVGGGCTAPSAVGSTPTGQSSLGNQNQTGYAGSRSNDTWRFTVGSQPAFSAGTLVDIDTATSGASDADFQGWFKAATVTGTGFTVNAAPLDTRNGARAASTGTYTAHWWNYNKVTWEAPTGSPFRYFVCSDRASPGTYHVLGPALRPVNPKNSGFNVDPLELEFDDFGATMMAASSSIVPWYVSDANCTSSTTNDNWVTTIASGAGSTTLIMSGNAPNSGGPGATILFDDTPALLSAASSALKAPVALPFDVRGNSYVFNSVVDLTTSNPTLMLPQGLVANDTILVSGSSNGGGRWYGDRLPPNITNGSFTFQGNAPITTKGLPGVYNVQGFGFTAYDLAFIGQQNGLTFMQDGGGGSQGSTYTNDQFITSGGTSIDYLGIAFLCRGVAAAGCSATWLGRTFMNAGNSAMSGISSAPTLYIDLGSIPQFDNYTSIGRGIVVSNTAAFRIGLLHFNGAGSPPVFVTCKTGTCFTDLILGDGGGVDLDTVGQPAVVNLSGGGNVNTSVFYNNEGGPASGLSLISGQRLQALNLTGIAANPAAIGQNRDFCYYQQGLFLDGLYVPDNGSPGTNSSSTCQSALSVGSSYPIFIADARMTAPTAGAPTAGGSVPTGNHSYQIVPVWQNGGEGTISAASNTVNVTAGKQTVPLTWTSTTGCKGYDIYRDGLLMFNLRPGVPNVQGCSSNSARDTLAAAGGGTASVGTFGGPTMLMPGTQGISSGGPVVAVGTYSGSRYIGTGALPTCSVTGAGAGATCTLSFDANDNWGAIAINTGTGPSSSGTLTLTFNSSYPNSSSYTFMLVNGASSWNARATVIGQSIAGVSSATVNWDNNGVNLTASQSGAYNIAYSGGGH